MHRLTSIVAPLLVGVSLAVGGPPLICHPFEIEDAACVPWGDGAFEEPRGLSGAEFVEATMALLETDAPALVRMEAMRRATIRCRGDARASSELLARVLGRALDAAAGPEQDGFAWFDAGFLAQSYEQIGLSCADGLGVRSDIVGYAWFERALALRPDDGQMHFGAALATAMSSDELTDRHMARAVKSATSDTLLGVNIERFESELGPNLEHHRRAQRQRRGR